MTHGFRAVLIGLGGAIIVLAGSTVTASAQSIASGDQYSGHAYAVGLTGVTLGGAAIPNQFIGDTGQLPIGGGAVNFGPGTVTLPGSLGSVTIVSETATGSNGTSTASSNVSNVVIGPGAGVGASDLVHATLLTADSAVTCAGKKKLASSVATLTVDGTTVTPTGAPNQTVTVPNVATVILNQQTYTPATNDAFANTVVITFLPALASAITGTIRISHAGSDLQCPPFTVSKTANGASSATATAGSNVTYGVTLTNQVNTACLLQSVSDFLPPQPGEGGVPFTYVSGGPTGGTASQSTISGQNVVKWTFASPPSIAAGGTFSFALVAHVPSNEPAGTYRNVAAYTSTCGAGSGIGGTNTFTSGALAGVTVSSATVVPPVTPVPPVPPTGGGLPAPGLPVGLGILGMVLTAGGIADVVGRRRKTRSTPLVK